MAQFVSCSWSVVCLSAGCNTTTVDRNLHARSVLQQRSVRGATGQDGIPCERKLARLKNAAVDIRQEEARDTKYWEHLLSLSINEGKCFAPK